MYVADLDGLDAETWLVSVTMLAMVYAPFEWRASGARKQTTINRRLFLPETLFGNSIPRIELSLRHRDVSRTRLPDSAVAKPLLML
jgi:hypothetical protein